LRSGLGRTRFFLALRQSQTRGKIVDIFMAKHWANHCIDSSTTKTIPIQRIYPSLHKPLISHSRRLRLAALRLLDSKLADPQHDQIEVLKRCLQGEEVSLDLQGVRERVLRIGRVGQVVGDEKGADLCARWLIAQLKVNLRPLWSPAAAALSSLSQRFGDLVWRLLFEELRKVTTSEPTGTISPSQSQSSERDQDVATEEEGIYDESDPWEEERSWRDPSAHQLRSIVNVWDDPERERKRLSKVSLGPSILIKFDPHCPFFWCSRSKNMSKDLMFSLTNTSFSLR